MHSTRPAIKLHKLKISVSDLGSWKFIDNFHQLCNAKQGKFATNYNIVYRSKNSKHSGGSRIIFESILTKIGLRNLDYTQLEGSKVKCYFVCNCTRILHISSILYFKCVDTCPVYSFFSSSFGLGFVAEGGDS